MHLGSILTIRCKNQTKDQKKICIFFAVYFFFNGSDDLELFSST